MTDHNTMRDHIEDLMQENALLHSEIRELRALAKQLADAIEIQVHCSRIPTVYTTKYYTQSARNALAAYDELVRP